MFLDFAVVTKNQWLLEGEMVVDKIAGAELPKTLSSSELTLGHRCW